MGARGTNANFEGIEDTAYGHSREEREQVRGMSGTEQRGEEQFKASCRAKQWSYLHLEALA